MALAMLTGRTPDLFDDPLGLRPVPEANVVLADARDLAGAWLPEHVGDEISCRTLTRLASALGATLTWD